MKEEEGDDLRSLKGKTYLADSNIFLRITMMKSFIFVFVF